MAYYLRQTKKAKGIYLQVYESSWNKELKQPRSRSVEAIGYVDELISKEFSVQHLRHAHTACLR